MRNLRKARKLGPAAVWTVALLLSATASAQAARVLSRQADKVVVGSDRPLGWTPGMAVWLSRPGPTGAGLPVAEGTVIYAHGGEALVALNGKDVDVPRGAVVEPRYVAEARVYGQGDAVRRAKAQAARDVGEQAGEGQGGGGTKGEPDAAPKPPAWQVWHKPPEVVEWGGQLWLELVGTREVSKVEARARQGDTGPFAALPMKANTDGLWSVALPLGETRPEVTHVQYYIVGEVTVDGGAASHTALAGHPSAPIRVRITSIPTRRETPMIVHDPPGRVSWMRDLVLTARINKRFKDPVVYVRPRGGGSYDALRMERVSPDVYRAVIPAARMVVPGVSYYISVTDPKGLARDAFASRHQPRNVQVTRGRILAGEEHRNRLLVDFATVDYGAGDGYLRTDIGLDRVFFGFLVVRVGAAMVHGKAPGLSLDAATGQEGLAMRDFDLYYGRTGGELRLGDYVSASADVLMGIHNDGAAGGLALGARLGDEQGAHVSASWTHLSDLHSDAVILDTVRASLSAPVGRHFRVAGTAISEDVLQDDHEGLRLMAELTWIATPHLAFTAGGGIAGRDADSASGTGAIGMKMAF